MQEWVKRVADASPSTITPRNPRVFLSYRFAEHGAVLPAITAHLTDVGIEVISDTGLRWFDFRLDASLLSLLDRADLVLFLDPSGENATPLPTSWWDRIKSAFNPVQRINQFWRSADLRGRLRVIVAPEGWLASPDRPWLVRKFYRAVWGNELQARFMLWLLFALLLFMSAVPFLVLVLPSYLFGRAVVNFERRHLQGQELARRLNEPWQAWEKRVADEVGIPVISVRLQRNDPCLVTEVVTTGGRTGLEPGRRLGAVILTMAGSLQRGPCKANLSTDLKLWASTATVLLVMGITLIGWLAVRYPFLRGVLVVGAAALALKLMVRKLHRLVLPVLYRRQRRDPKKRPHVVAAPGSDGTPPP